jgi:hypothetical protein
MKLRLPIVLFAGILLVFTFLLSGNSKVSAQIYEPEGLNMPGAWDGWTNPPVNPVLANPNQSAGGLLTKISTGQTRWQTIFSVNASGANLVGGTYNWLFTSGPSSNYYANKWAGVTVAMNTLQSYTFNTGSDNSITLVNGKWYTMNWEDLGYVSSRAIFMETSAAPVQITSVSVPVDVFENLPVIIQVTAGATPVAEEIVYVRYTTDGWATSQALIATMTGANGQVSIPGQPSGTSVNYYAFSSTVTSLIADFDLYTIHLNNNGGTNYTYTVGTAPEPEITWANLQWPANGAIEIGGEFNVFGQAYIEGITGQPTPAAGLSAWVGYSTTDTDPSTWTNWVVATHNGASGNNDEFIGDIGAVISVAGTYYYAARFQYNDDPFVYGGFNGGFWNGTTNISGVLTVTDPAPDPDFDWVNLQFPGSATIEPGENLDVFAQAYIEGVTGQASPAPGVTAWIGYSTSNTNPNGWTNWFPSTFNGPVGNNDEYLTNLGQYITSEGTYYYASRFRLNTGEYYYGGYSASGGGFWDGTTYVSGILTVQSAQPDPGIDWANLQFPGSGEITIGGDFDVYAQAFIEGLTGQSTATPGLEAWIGYSTSNTNPSAWTNWVAALYNAPSGNNDEFMVNLGPEITSAGTYYYASRFRYDGGAYVYGGFSETGGGFWNGTANVSGVLTVNEPQQTFPVMFTIIDGTELHDNIKLKGEMTAWDTIAMIPDNHTWTLTLNLLPGTYEWGAIEGDGSPDGIWLIEGDNLVMTLNEFGEVSGTVIYTTMVTYSPALPYGSLIYPNPARNLLNLEIPGLSDYQLLDVSGRIILENPLARENQTIDLSGLESGLYLLKIRVGERLFVKKVVKE